MSMSFNIRDEVLVAIGGIDAVIRFLEGGGKQVIDALLEDAIAALGGEIGTHVAAHVQ